MATPEFTFKSAAYGADTFTVVDFQGTEAISSLYQFNIGLKCEQSTNIDLEALMKSGANLSIEQDGNTNSYNGILAWAEQRQVAGGFMYFRVLLVPPMWRLSQNVTSAGFTWDSHPAIAEEVLDLGGISRANGELDTSGMTGTVQPPNPGGQDTQDDTNYTYPAYDFTCQYAESDLNFVCRLLENDGIYFYFEEQGEACKLMLADAMDYPELAAMPSIPFTDPSSTNGNESIVQISQHLAAAPGEATIMGYNYQTTSVEVTGSKAVTVDDKPAGGGPYPNLWLYDGKVQTPDAAGRIALVRAEEQGCWACTYAGSGAYSGMRSGFTFSLTGHPVKAFNQKYLVTGVTHTARNLDQSWTTANYTAAQGSATGAYYSNSFTAIPASVQFRPQRVTPKPRISGVISATVWLPPQDGSEPRELDNLALQPGQTSPIPGYQSSGQNPNPSEDPTVYQNTYLLPAPPMDAQGRYLVTLPFTNSRLKQYTPISAWIRMAQPSAGVWTGAQFTLEPGAEVLLAFVNGDPDLPLIVGSVYNGAMPAPLVGPDAEPNI